VNVGGPSGDCYLPKRSRCRRAWTGILWIGPPPTAPTTTTSTRSTGAATATTRRQTTGLGRPRLRRRASTAWETPRDRPIEVHPPDGKDYKNLTLIFANGVRLYHGGGWGGIMSYKGMKASLPNAGRARARRSSRRTSTCQLQGPGRHLRRLRPLRPDAPAPLPRHRDRPSHGQRLPPRQHRHWLKRPLKWDPEKEESSATPGQRWLDRTQARAVDPLSTGPRFRSAGFSPYHRGETSQSKRRPEGRTPNRGFPERAIPTLPRRKQVARRRRPRRRRHLRSRCARASLPSPCAMGLPPSVTPDVLRVGMTTEAV